MRPPDVGGRNGAGLLGGPRAPLTLSLLRLAKPTLGCLFLFGCQTHTDYQPRELIGGQSLPLCLVWCTVTASVTSSEGVRNSAPGDVTTSLTGGAASSVGSVASGKQP